MAAYKVKVGMMYTHKGEVLNEGAAVEVDGQLSEEQKERLEPVSQKKKPEPPKEG